MGQLGSRNPALSRTNFLTNLPDPGGRPRKGFVGLSVGRSVTFSYPAMINTLPFGRKFSNLVNTSGTLSEVTEPNIT